jgi:nucleotide-binding universal stress UspA family protein
MGDATTEPSNGPLVVGYDGREESEIALDRALEEASQRHVSVLVLVVAQIPIDAVNPVDPTDMGLGTVHMMGPDGPIEIQPILAAARRKLEASGVQGKVIWAMGSPASEILRAADENDATAIVVGTHHHSAIARFLGGDVAATVVRAAHHDVIVAR